MKSWQHTFLLGAGFGAMFLLGQWLPRPGPASSDGRAPDARTLDARTLDARTLDAQGRGAVNPPPPPAPKPSDNGAPEVVYAESGGSSGSGNGFVAVTGSYGVGTSVLYVLDTVGRQLAVYEARGGSTEQRRLVLVGARRIDLDLQIESYNDRSEFDYPRLQELFQKRGRKDHEPKTGLETGGAKR